VNRRERSRVLKSRNHYRQSNLPEPGISQLKHAHAVLTLAAVLSAAAPAFADRLSVEHTSRDLNFSFEEGTIDKWELSGEPAWQSFRKNSLEKSKMGGSAEPGFRINDVSRDERISEFAALLTSGITPENGPLKLFEFDPNNNFLSEHVWKARGVRRNGDSFGVNGSKFLVPVPEPGSQTLLLFGFVGLGLLFFRRNNLNDAIA
jgi:PEP-CTERM motif